TAIEMHRKAHKNGPAYLIHLKVGPAPPYPPYPSSPPTPTPPFARACACCRPRTRRPLPAHALQQLLLPHQQPPPGAPPPPPAPPSAQSADYPHSRGDGLRLATNR